MSESIHPPFELPGFEDLNPFGGPYTPDELVQRYGLDGVALETRRRCIANPLFLASEVLSVLWQKNLMRQASEAHREVAEAMVKQESILYVDARGTAKTTLLDEVGGVHQLLSYCDDSLLFLQASEVNAKALIAQIRVHFTTNPVLRALFPEYAMEEREGSALSFSVPCRRVRSREKSVEVGTPGSSLAGRHYDHIFCTDVINENTSPPPCGKATLELMKGLVSWYAQSDGLLKGKEINERASKRIDSNRWHDADLVGSIIRAEDRVGKRTFRRVIRGVRKGEDGRWIPTWPEVKTHEMLAEIHDGPTMNAATWAANFCSDPLPEGGMTFLREWFHTYGPSTLCGECDKKHLQPEQLSIAITLDPAFSDGKSVKKKGSRSAIVVSGVSEKGLLYILQTAAGQWSPNETVKKLYEIIDFWRIHDDGLWVGIEETGASRGLIAIFQNEMVRSGRYVPYRTIKPATKAKDSPDRIGPLHAHAQNLGIYVKPEHQELVDELLRFGVSERNDLADALSFRAMELYSYARQLSDGEADPTANLRNLVPGRDFVDTKKIITPPRRNRLAPWLGSMN